jgi:hypothetical protein
MQINLSKNFNLLIKNNLKNTYIKIIYYLR